MKFLSILLLSFFLASYVSGRISFTQHHQKVFFPPESLKIGKQFTLRSIGHIPPSDLRFLSKEEADKIPFSSSQLSYLFDLFGFPEGTLQAQGMENTIRICEADPLEGEVVHCATSLESMLDFVRQMIGTNKQVKPLYTPPLKNMDNTSVMYHYTIVGKPQRVHFSKLVACHRQPYPYALYYCHTPDNFSRVFKVPITVQGNNVDAIVNCHMNTTKWNPTHQSFTISGIKHGSPACHFMPTDHFNWVPLVEPRDLKDSPKVAQM